MSSLGPEGLRSFLRFSMIAYWPVCLFEVLFGWGFVMNLWLSSAAETPTTGSNAAFMLQGGIALIVPVAVMLLTYRAYSRSTDWKRRAWILYAGWLPTVLVIGLVLAAAFGGASQAVVEGAAGTWSDRYRLYLASALKTAVVAHVFIVPLILIAVRTLKRADR